MKKIMLVSALFIIFITGSFAATGMRPCATMPTGIWIKLLINFHRPKMDCESGFGICMMFSWGIEEKRGQPDKSLCPARGQLNDRNQLLIEMNETDLRNLQGGYALSFMKGKTTVTIQDPYTLPDATCRELGSAGPLTIKPGDYPVSSRNGVYTIVFQF